MALLDIAADYAGGQLANLSKADKTAAGETDDKEPDSPGQRELIDAGSTDAREAANIVFTGNLRVPAELMAAGVFYDMTQSYTRINAIYAMTRESYYSQAETEVKTRKNRLQHKQEIIANCVRLSEEPKKALEKLLDA